MPVPPGNRLRAALLATLLAAALCACGAPPKDGAAAAGTPSAKPLFEIEGTVKLPGALDHSGIQIFVPGSSLLAMTDLQGGYALAGVPEGVHVVMAQKAGFKTAKLGEVEATAFAPSRKLSLPEVTMEPQGAAASEAKAFGAIQGSIRLEPDGAGADLARARIGLEGTPMRTFAEADGTFLLWNLEPGDYTLSITLDGFYPYRSDVKVKAGSEPTAVDVALAAAGSDAQPAADREIAGTVEMYYSDGTEAADHPAARVGLRELSGKETSVNEDGSFLITGLAAGAYTVYAVAEGYELFAEANADLTKRPRTEITLTLLATGTNPNVPGKISGVAIKDSPKPVKDMSGISVAIAGTSHVAVTNAQGFYEIKEIAPGTYDVIAQAEGFESVTVPGVEVRPGGEIELDDIHLRATLNYPVVLDASPADGTDDVLIQFEIPVTIRFSKKMKPETLKRATKLEPSVGYSIYAGKERRESDEDTLYLVINAAGLNTDARAVNYGQSFRLTIGTEAEDYEGLHLQEPFTLRFKTGKPAVMDTSPAEGASDAVLNPGDALIFRFNAKIDPNTIDPKDIRIRPSLPVIPNVQTINDAATGWSAVHIQCLWKPDTKYQVTLPSRIRTATGQKVSNLPFTLRFKTSEISRFPGLNPTTR